MAGASGKSTKTTWITTLPIDFNRSLIRGKPIATSPRPSETGILQFNTERAGGVGVGEGEEVAEGVGVIEGAGVDVGVAEGVDVAVFNFPVLCQINFLFFFTHLNSNPPEMEIFPTFVHDDPALIAAKEGASDNEIAKITPIATLFTR